MHHGCGHPEILWQIHLRSNPGVLLRQVNFNYPTTFLNKIFSLWRNITLNEEQSLKTRLSMLRALQTPSDCLTSKLNCFFLTFKKKNFAKSFSSRFAVFNWKERGGKGEGVLVHIGKVWRHFCLQNLERIQWYSGLLQVKDCFYNLIIEALE